MARTAPFGPAGVSDRVQEWWRSRPETFRANVVLFSIVGAISIGLVWAAVARDATRSPGAAAGARPGPTVPGPVVTIPGSPPLQAAAAGPARVDLADLGPPPSTTTSVPTVAGSTATATPAGASVATATSPLPPAVSTDTTAPGEPSATSPGPAPAPAPDPPPPATLATTIPRPPATAAPPPTTTLRSPSTTSPPATTTPSSPPPTTAPPPPATTATTSPSLLPGPLGLQVGH